MTNNAPTAANIFLQSSFGPDREEVTADNLTVIGKLPPEMDGMFVRNGPNPQFPPIKKAVIASCWREGPSEAHGAKQGRRLCAGFDEIRKKTRDEEIAQR
jgi:hypothetical protein